jgi:hypothetical protein
MSLGIVGAYNNMEHLDLKFELLNCPKLKHYQEKKALILQLKVVLPPIKFIYPRNSKVNGIKEVLDAIKKVRKFQLRII